MPTKYSSPRGTLDYLPPESVKLLHAEAIFRFVCENYCYQPVRTPTFESTELFARGEGESSDIVSKEMYTFPDKKGRSLTLRPEGTPGVVRAMIQAGWNFSDLTRVYYVEPMFRYQRPQKGRYREHTQVGVEILGTESVTADVEVISLGVNFIKQLGLENLRVAINTVGSAEDRKAYNVILKDFIDGHRDDFCPDCHFRAEHNPMRVFDCKVNECHEALKNAPGIFDSLSGESRERFEDLKNMLSAENIIFDEDFTLVRGLDYYTHTVFEVMIKGDEGQQSSLMGGGRYDGLVELYGGPATPAMGFGCGLERVIEAVDWSDVADLLKPTCDIALIALGERALREGTRLADELRNRGISVHIDHRKMSMKNQLGQANTLNAALAIIIGDNELDEGKVIFKDMETGEQEAFELGSVVEYLTEVGESEGDE
ncbi:MAG: histidine--tRNA ligase [bacterium]